MHDKPRTAGELRRFGLLLLLCIGTWARGTFTESWLHFPDDLLRLRECS